MADKRRMNLHFLGTAGYHPSDRRQTSCLFLPEAGIVLDAGTGLYRAAPLIKSDTVRIFLSHAHLDHTFGLTCLLDIFAKKKLRKVFVYAEQAKIDAIRTGMLHPLMFPAEIPIEWIPLESMRDDTMVIGKATIRWFPLLHPGGSIGYRIDWPKLSLAYVTDTTAQSDSAYWDVVRGVDWLIHECNFNDKEREFAKMTGHSWTSEVLQGAKRAKVQNLVLTHLQPVSESNDPLDLAQVLSKHLDIGPDRVMVAEDQLCIELNSK